MIGPPRFFSIMGQRHTVMQVPPGVAMNMTNPDAVGTTHHDESKVRIRAVCSGGLSPIQQIDTYLHEALHAICYTAGLRRTLRLDGNDEECLVGSLTPQILLLLRDNPRVTKYLTQKLPGINDG